MRGISSVETATTAATAPSVHATTTWSNWQPTRIHHAIKTVMMMMMMIIIIIIMDKDFTVKVIVVSNNGTPV